MKLIKVTLEFSKQTIVLLALAVFTGYLLGNVFSVPNMTGQVVKTTTTAGDVQQEQQQPPRIEVSTDGEPYLGDDDAPVVVVEFTDFQCPFCKRAHDETFPLIKQNYIDTGKVKYVVKDFPLSIHPNADEASEAANCVFEQDSDAYWEFADMLFNQQSEWQLSSTPFTVFKEYAKDLGLDSAKFGSCVDSDKYASEVEDDFQQGVVAGVSGTPSFFVNGLNIVGAQPYSVFQQVIDSEL